MKERLRVSPRGPESQTCPLCKDSLVDSEARVAVCGDCSTRYHQQCHSELGGCSTLGCAGRLAPTVKVRATERRVNQAGRRRIWLWVIFAGLAAITFFFVVVLPARRTREVNARRDARRQAIDLQFRHRQEAELRQRIKAWRKAKRLEQSRAAERAARAQEDAKANVDPPSPRHSRDHPPGQPTGS